MYNASGPIVRRHPRTRPGHHHSSLIGLSAPKSHCNQNGTFKKKADLSRDAGDIDPALLDILKLLGNDLREHLLDPTIDTVFDDLAQKDGSFVVTQITAAVSKIISDQNAMDQRRPALSALLVWLPGDPRQRRVPHDARRIP